MTTPPGPDEPAPLPVAYCAPGHLIRAEQILDENGDEVAEIVEHPYLVGQDGVLLVAPGAEKPDQPFAGELFRKCGFCGGILPWHSVTCYVYWLVNSPLPPLSACLGSSVTGI